MNFSVNSPILFVLAGIIIFAVLAQSVFFLVRAVRRSKEIGMDQQKLRKTMITAGVFTIAPAVAIVISVITLSRIWVCRCRGCVFRSSAPFPMRPLPPPMPRAPWVWCSVRSPRLLPPSMSPLLGL